MHNEGGMLIIPSSITIRYLRPEDEPEEVGAQINWYYALGLVIWLGGGFAFWVAVGYLIAGML